MYGTSNWRWMWIVGNSEQKLNNEKMQICSLFDQICSLSLRPANMHSFLKKFYGCVTKSNYIVLRLGFVMTHCRGNPKFNFHKYMIRALEDDFKKVVGIRQAIAGISCANCTSSYLFFCVRWLLLAVGTKLEHVITQLAHEVAEKHIAIEGELVVQPSDNHFWFHRPPIVLFLMHFILFQNAFEIAFFFWIWLQYGFDSCIMGHVRFIIHRLVIGVFVQVLCSYSTLPLYAIVTQVSPLNRSKRTAEIIWSARKEEIITDSDMREIDLDSFQVSLISQHLFHQMCSYIICFNDFSSRLRHRVFQDFTAEQLWCECAGFHPTTRGWKTPNSPIAAGSFGGRKTSNRIILVCHGSSQSGSKKHFLGIIRT
ncbi:hypothetical protein ACSBR1_009050 [Camellia fascicularis]